MSRRMSVPELLLSLAAVLLVIAGCASPGQSALPALTARTSAPQPTAAGGPSTAEGLCGVVTEEMAVAALGGPVAEPTGGEVVPRPNGIYCHYAAADDANTNVEAQLKDMTQAEFEALAETLGMSEPLEGVGDAAFQLERSTMGGAGASVAAWADGRGVTVIINAEGDQAAMLAAVKAIATAVLAGP